jgi:hypothetical protein
MNGGKPVPFNQGGPVTDYLTDVGEGWHLLLRELHAALAEKGPYETFQVKEKFGLLRVYIEATTDGQQEIVYGFEERSGHICEVCGKPGEPGTHGGWWIKTLCPEHSEVRQAEVRQRQAGTPK